VYRFESGDPQSGGLLVFLGFLFVVTLQVAFVTVTGLFAVAVVRLVVHGHDVLHAHEVRHDALEHLTLGFERLQRWSSPLKE